MKNREVKRERPKNWKRKFASALCMLLISSILMATSSYAWLIMSIAPEVTGMTANVGANGALEIALLNKETREDLSQIPTLGGSLATRNPSANNSWGNIIDLSYDVYGLSDFVLWPSRLNVVNPDSAGNFLVDTNLLSVPTYGYDGRIIELTDNTLSAVYDGTGYSMETGSQDYGVRIIGTSDTISVQGSALATAKSSILTYNKSANTTAKTAMVNNSDGLMNIMLDRGAAYDDSDLNVLKSLVQELQQSVSYIDLSLRQGIIAYAAANVADVETFDALKDTVSDTGKSLSSLLSGVTGFNLPEGFTTWIAKVEQMQGTLTTTADELGKLTGGSYTWADFQGPLTTIMDTEKVFINDDKLEDFDAGNAMELVGTEVIMTLAPDSGILADIADYADDISATFKFMGMIDVTIQTTTAMDPPYLLGMSDAVQLLQAADGSTAEGTKVSLTTTFGYAVDLAFRTNAPVSNLLLQTTPKQRVYDGSEESRTMGGGSYMEFTTDDEYFTLERMLYLMDAIRVGFVDDQGNLIQIAKLNTSNRVVTDGVVQAPLYLYSFHFDQEDGSLQMDERQKSNNAITSLDQNVAKALTVVVWLDGDIVDNSMVATSAETSLNGILNLQFSSSANLVAGQNNALENITADKTELAAAIQEHKETYEGGQRTFTTVSWNAYADAYNYAVAVNENEGASEQQIYMASYDLENASTALTVVSHEALQEKILQLRDMMGTSQDLARIVLEDPITHEYYCVSQYTQEQQDQSKGQIMQVDYEKNLKDNGDGVKTPIWTDATWSALANALYHAEAVDMNDDATDQQIDAAITAMTVSQDALQNAIFFTAYDYNDNIFYHVISDDTTDNYDKWYDANFERITSDLTILNLETKGRPAQVATLIQDAYVKNDPKLVTPYIEINDDIYPAFTEDQIKAVQWKLPDFFVQAMTPDQVDYLNALILEAKSLPDISTTVLAAAESIISGETTAENAAAVIENLEKAIEAAKPEDPSQSETTESSEPEVTDPALLPMRADDRTVLTAAISAARALAEEAKNTEGKETLAADLQDAADSAEQLLAADNATQADAQTALDSINTQIVKAGGKEVTAYNTLTTVIPVTSEIKEVAYQVQHPGTTLYLTGETGKTTISATVLTKNGVVYSIEKEIEIYSYAAGAEISGPATAPEGGAMINPDGTENTETEEEIVLVWDGKLMGGYSVDLTTGLVARQKQKVDAEGNPVYEKDDEGNDIQVEGEKVPVMESLPMQEKIESYRWTSADPSIIKIDNADQQKCTLTAVGAGNVTVSVSIETVQGNTYSATFQVDALQSNAGGVEVVIPEDLQAEAGTPIELTAVLLSRIEEIIDEESKEIIGTKTWLFNEKITALTWNATDAQAIHVTQDGKLIPLKTGAVSITVTAKTNFGNSYTSEPVTITVAAPKKAASITVNPQSIDMGSTATSEVTAALVGRTLKIDEDNEIVLPFQEEIVSYQWVCQDESIATLENADQATCLVKAVAGAGGETTVTLTAATSEGSTYEAEITVKVAAAETP